MIQKKKTKIASLCLKFGKKPNDGSILLEIAIALSIIGLIAGFLATKTIVANKIMRAQTAKNNIETIIAAMTSFLANNHRLPMPADKNSRGLERDFGGGDLDTVGHCIGLVPFGVLELSEKDATDGNGRPLIYAVEPYLTHNFQRIYRDASDNAREYQIGVQDFFCNDIAAPKIALNRVQQNTLQRDVIAFVITTEKNYPKIIDNQIVIKISADTRWVTRDLLLMKYMKSCPCKMETPASPLSQQQQDAFHSSSESITEFDFSLSDSN